jgi:hypothetical protein
LQLQEELRATQLAIEQNRVETKAAAVQNAEALSKGLQAIQKAFAVQRAQDLEAMQRSNKIMLVVVGIIGATGLLTLLIMICFQWRMSKGLAEISIVLPTALELGPGFAAPMLPQAPPSDSRLLGATDRPEPRNHEQEPSLPPAPRRRERTGKSIESRLFPGGGDSLRRQQFRALRAAVIVGLICAAVLALLFYVVTTRKWGFN